MIHTSLIQYRITATIGAGGMGEVFRARDTRLNRDMGIKVLPGDFVSDAGRLRRFEPEAKALAALNHPNVLAIAFPLALAAFGFYTSQAGRPIFQDARSERTPN